MTSTPRVQALRDRRKASGLSEVRGIWAPKDQHQRIKLTHARKNTRDTEWYFAVIWPLLPIPGEYDGMDDCDQLRWREVVRQAIGHAIKGERSP